MTDNIGIITVLFKSDAVLEDFINSLNGQTHQEFEVLFIENEVENYFTEAYIKQHSKFKYFFMRNAKNEGVAVANNQGIDHFSTKYDTDYILFLNNDIVFDNNFLEKHVEYFHKYDYVDALAPKMFYHQPGNKIWYAGGTLSYFKGNCRHWGHNKRDKLVGKDLFRVSYAPTCSLMVKKEVLVESRIRMWENLFVYFDDYVFSMELKKNKVKLYYTPNIHLLHKISISTGGRKSEFSRYYLSRNWTYLMRKQTNVGLLLIPFWMAYNVIRGLKIENKAIIDSFKMA
jgi:GT2 family glycosyltransferase